MMQHVVLPFKLSKDVNTKAVSEIRFTVQSPRSSFRAVRVSGLRFMRVYEQERYNLGNRPFTQFWDDYTDYLNLQRENISIGNLTRNGLSMGHLRSPEMRALDELPHWIELSMEQASPIDRSSIALSAQQEYQSDSPFTALIEDPSKVQSMLIMNTNLFRGEYGGYEGTASCDMRNLGSFRLRNEGQGTQFIIKACMYNFNRRALSVMPSIQLELTFI